MPILVVSAIVLLNFLLGTRERQLGFWNSWLNGADKMKLLVFLILSALIAGAVLYLVGDAALPESWEATSKALAVGGGAALASRISPSVAAPNQQIRSQTVLDVAFLRVSQFVDEICQDRITTWGLDQSYDDLVLWSNMMRGSKQTTKQQLKFRDEAIRDMLSGPRDDPTVIGGRGRLIDYLAVGYINNWTHRPKMPA